MFYFRSINRFILISLFISGLTISSVVSAKTFLVEFQTSAFTSTAPASGSTPTPYWPLSFTPGETLFDFTFDAIAGDGLLVDDPGLLHVQTAGSPASQATNLHLYNWGHTGQHGVVSASIQTQSPFDMSDIARNGLIDQGNTGPLFSTRAPDSTSLPPHPPYRPLTIESLLVTDLLGMDRIRIFGLNQVPRSISGDWVISEVSAVPVPAAVWLFGTALTGLPGFGKRKPGLSA